MTVVELLRSIAIEDFVPYAPFVYSSRINALTQADWWTDVFGAPDETTTETIHVGSFYSGSGANRYSPAATLNDCVSQEESFFWDNDTQTIYVHFEQSSSWYNGNYSYGRAYGFANEDVLYIDDTEYLPLLRGVPSIAQQQDLQNYGKLAFINGSITLDNASGDIDWMIDVDLNGQEIIMYDLDNDDITQNSTARSNLVSLATFYIEDTGIGNDETDIRVQDLRKAENISIPVDKFAVDDYPNIEEKYINKSIPLLYGPISEALATPVDGDSTGNVTFRLCKTLTVLGQVQIFEADVWTNVSTVSEDLSAGEFVLAYADCRKGGTTTGDVLKCQVLSAAGEVVTYASDVIKLLNLEGLGITYNNSNYDTTEWEQEETSLSEVGVLFDKSIFLFDAIKQVQSGANIGFRYEIKAEGRRTIRIDDNTRDIAYTVDPTEIKNRTSLRVETDSTLLAAIAQINYKQNYESGDYRVERNTDFQTEVVERYRQSPTLEIDTLLQTEALAEERALDALTRFSVIPRFIEIDLMGEQWYNLRIYDTLQIAITSGEVDYDTGIITGREFYGIWKVKVVAIDPDFDNIQNSVRLQLIKRIYTVLVKGINQTDTLVINKPDGYDTLVIHSE